MRKVFALILTVFIEGTAMAGVTPTPQPITVTSLASGYGMAAELANYLYINNALNRNTSTGMTYTNGMNGFQVGEAIADTPVEAWGIPVNTPSFAATPVAGTNCLPVGISVVPTYAANVATFLGCAATPVPGAMYHAVNTGPNSVRLKAAGGATLNNADAGGYIVLPANGNVDCKYTSASNVACILPPVPTPAGP